jgi:hypothetical protein
MHCHPWVLVKADSREAAVMAASAWLAEQLGGDCPYDYGDAVAKDEDRDAEDKSESVIVGGTEKFREVVKSAIDTERRVLREHWDITRQFVNAYEEPPGGLLDDDDEAGRVLAGA